MRINIGAKLIVGFMLVVLLMATLAFYSLNMSQKTLKESVGISSILLAAEIMNRIDQNIFLNINELQKYSKGYLLEKTLLESNKEFEKLDSIEEYINRKDREWISASKDETTPFMKILISNELSDEMREEFIQFYEKKYGYKVFEVVFVTNKYGANFAQTEKRTDYRQDDEEWWQVAKERNFYVSDIEYDERAETHGITIGVRIDDKEGNFIGIMKALVGAKEIIREAVIATKKYETTGIKLITKKGNLIYATRAFKFLEDISGKEFFKKIKGERGFFIAKEGGRERLFSYTHSKGYRNFEGRGWIFVVGHDTGEILKPARALRKSMVTASLVLIAIGILVAFFMSRSISKPIARLTKGAEIIGKGDLGHRVEVKTKDEIGILANAFNNMVEDLNQTAGELKVAQEDLIRSERLATLGQFSGNISHELRNPLGVIDSSIYYLKTKLKGGDEKVQEHLDRIKSSVGSATTVIQSLLDLTRMREPQLKRLDLTTITSETIATSKIPAEVKVIQDLGDQEILVNADGEQLRMAFKNIITNAVDAMDGKGTLTVRAGTAVDGKVDVSFDDTGSGIAPENLDRVFQPLFSTKAKGIGFGLSIVMMIAERHGGTVEAKSKPGKGATITVKLPL
ncbi:MAG: HAMP domain-containing protein [Desulfobacteraceae bacterium]|nr:HAMP domain-containing protein [Desulfobacteraceae bacterium]